jgi:non-ribosomal peptide synthetase component E (peptide arylation enzyme)
MLAQIAKENPYKDVVRYEHKNRKWNLHHVDYYSEALAIGLLENGLQPGDVVLSWLPAHFSESVSYIMCMR